MIVLSEVTLIGSANRAPGREQLPSKFAGNSLLSPRTASRSLYPRTQGARKARGQRLAMSTRPVEVHLDPGTIKRITWKLRIIPPRPRFCPSRHGAARAAAGAASQSFMVRSSPAEARVRPSGLKATGLIQRVCPRTVTQGERKKFSQGNHIPGATHSLVPGKRGWPPCRLQDNTRPRGRKNRPAIGGRRCLGLARQTNLKKKCERASGM
jgi:hypothetical protein